MPFRVHGLADPFAQEAVGHVVVVLGPLVLDRGALHLELLLGHGVEQEAHPVRLQPKELLELVVGRGLEIVGAIWARRAVQRAAGLGDDLEVLFVADVLRALEHHVLEEVREAGLADLLAGRADVVGDVDVYEGVGYVPVQDDS